MILRKVSQKDIAESLKISRVTVTKALQEHPEIARETIQRVKKKALEMGYIPDFIGRSLSSRRTHTIGLAVPKIAHSFFSYSLERMYEAGRRKGYHILPMVSFEDRERELDNIRTLLSMRVEGIILDIAQNSIGNSSYELAMRAGCRVLYFDRCPEDFSGCAVTSDDLGASYKLTRLLVSKGYRKIYHLAGPPFLNISSDRKKGYEKALYEEEISGHIYRVDLTRESGKQALVKLLGSGERPEAIFAVNDPVAHGVYDAAMEMGLKIPDDLAVAGFGDIDTSAILQPPMTSIRPPLEEMADAAVELLVDMIENDAIHCERKVFPSRLMERQST